jgi:hypothetical protein
MSGRDPEGAVHERLDRLLDLVPVGYAGNPLHLLFVAEAHPVRDAVGYLRALDGGALVPERREYILNPPADWPFPHVTIAQRPDPACVSELLFTQWDLAREVILRQADIGDRLVRLATAHHADVVVLVIVDGLSYYDLPEDVPAEPVLVDGVSITAHGYPAVIGKPSVSQKMFNAGYRRQMGFTYFERSQNALAAELFGGFAESQVQRVRSLDEVLKALRAAVPIGTFIQITAMGLDHLAHSHHDTPPVGEYLARLLQRFHELVAVVRQGRYRVVACLTADHGILWWHQLGTDPPVLEGVFGEDERHPRYTEGALLRPHTRVISHARRAYTVLQAPYLTRKLRQNEWGVHGGISAWESLVPLVILKE